MSAGTAEDAGDLVLVSSSGRNGGTLLLRLLDACPRLWVHPIDVVYLTAWDDLAGRGELSYDTRRGLGRKPLTNLDRPLSAAALREEFGRHWVDIDEWYVPLLVEPLERGPDPQTLIAGDGDDDQYEVDRFLPAFLRATRAAYGPRRRDEPDAYVFKSVETAYVEEWVRLFPAIRCLHLVRDPVTNWASVKRSWSYHQAHPFYFGGRDVLRDFVERRWLPQAAAALRLSRHDPRRHRIVRYEDLTHEPGRTIAEICAWLATPPPEPHEELTSLGGRRMTAMPVEPRPSKPGIAAPVTIVPDMAARYSYDEVVSDRERALLAATIGSVAEALGYGSPAPGLPGRLLLLGRWLPVDASERLHVRSRLRWLWELARRRAWIARVVVRPPGASA